MAKYWSASLHNSGGRFTVPGNRGIFQSREGRFRGMLATRQTFVASVRVRVRVRVPHVQCMSLVLNVGTFINTNSDVTGLVALKSNPSKYDLFSYK